MVGDILQPTHLLFVLVVALLVLGPKRLPEVGRTLGNGIRDFRSAINGESNDRHEEIDSHPWPHTTDAEAVPEPEFAHVSETAPDAHVPAPIVPPIPVKPASAGPGPADPAPAAAIAPEPAASTPAAQTPPKSVQPPSTSDTDSASGKHEFAYESPTAADSPARPRT